MWEFAIITLAAALKAETQVSKEPVLA